MILPYLIITNVAGKGRGVYTTQAIPAGTIIEVAPVIVMPITHKVQLDATLLHDYIFYWGEHEELCAMALGYVPIYNHSYSSNCEYTMQYAQHTITITTVQAIAAHMELTINYNGDWDCATPVWFGVVE